MALMADGVAPADLYPLDLEPATAEARCLIKDDVVFWDSGAESRAAHRLWRSRHVDDVERPDVERDARATTVRSTSSGTSRSSAPTTSSCRRARRIARQRCGSSPGSRAPRTTPRSRSTSRTGPRTSTRNPDPPLPATSRVNHVDANTAYFDDAYLVDNLDDIDVALGSSGNPADLTIYWSLQSQPPKAAGGSSTSQPTAGRCSCCRRRPSSRLLLPCTAHRDEHAERDRAGRRGLVELHQVLRAGSLRPGPDQHVLDRDPDDRGLPADRLPVRLPDLRSCPAGSQECS